jgi:hypothetical protein
MNVKSELIELLNIINDGYTKRDGAIIDEFFSSLFVPIAGQ